MNKYLNPKRIKNALIYRYDRKVFDLFINKIIPPNFFSEKVVLIIGGKVNPMIEERLLLAKKIIRVDVSEEYIGSPNTLDIKADAHHLPMLEDNSVDCVLSSHVIEHLIDPIQAISEWRRILKAGGLFYASIPNYKKTFDHRRKLTTLHHLIGDYKKQLTEPDEEHYKDFLTYFDVEKDFVFNTYEEWHSNYITNPLIYTHFHVFDKKLVKQMMQYVGIHKVNVFHNNISVEYFGVKI